MKETATCCSISWKKKLQLFSIIAILLITAVVWSNKVVVLEKEAEELVPFSSGPSFAPESMSLPTENPPS